MTLLLPPHLIDGSGADDGDLLSFSAIDGEVIWAPPPDPGSGLGVGNRFDDPNDTLWSGSTANDLEFATDDLSGTLPSGWAWVNQGGATYVQKFGAALITAPSSGGDNLRIIERSLISGTWEATLKLSISTLNNNYYGAGFSLRASGNSKVVIYHLGAPLATNAHPSLQINEYTNPTTFSNSRMTAVTMPGFPRYLRLRKNSTTSYDFEASLDGIGWFTLKAADNPEQHLGTGNTDKFGLFVNRLNSSVAAQATFDWLRVR